MAAPRGRCGHRRREARTGRIAASLLLVLGSLATARAAAMPTEAEWASRSPRSPSDGLDADHEGMRLLVPWRLFEGDMPETRITHEDLAEAVHDFSDTLEEFRNQTADEEDRTHVPTSTQSDTSISEGGFPRSSGTKLRGRHSLTVESGLRSTANSTEGENKSVQPVLNFLFMSMGKMAHHELWESFFSQSKKGLWRIFLHCASGHSCYSSLRQRNPLQITLVKTVPSSYCHDLVSPMVQLLRSALADSQSVRDKFVFLSDSTLPVKPFHIIYHELTQDRSSDLCIVPRIFWPVLPFQDGEASIVKHSQWAVLNKWHAKRMVWRWWSVKRFRARYWSIPVWPDASRSPYTIKDFGKLAQANVPLCSDEWAIFATLYGAVMHRGQAHESLPGFSKSPLWIAGQYTLKQMQGSCRTFWWHEGVSTDSRFASVAHAVAPFLSCSDNCRAQGSHPAEFWAVSDHTLSVLKGSPFLFARKFSEGVVRKEQFERIILEQR